MKTYEIRKKVYSKSQILECPSIGEYWNIFSVPVLYSIIMKSLFPKPLTSTPDMLLICIIGFLLQLK